MTEILRQIFRTKPILLSGAFVYESLHTPENRMRIRMVKIIYDESTSAAAGVEIRIGKIGDADYFATFTTEASKVAGSVTVLQQIINALEKDETLTIECDGGKSGGGTVSVQIECYHNLVF